MSECAECCGTGKGEFDDPAYLFDFEKPCRRCFGTGDEPEQVFTCGHHGNELTWLGDKGWRCEHCFPEMFPNYETDAQKIARLEAEVEILRADVENQQKIIDPFATVQDLEMKIRDGQIHLHVVGSEEGGSPGMRLLCALVLTGLLGEENEMPPNYRYTEWKFKPGNGFEEYRIVAEFIGPGGKSSHEIREELEKDREQLKEAVRVSGTTATLKARGLL